MMLLPLLRVAMVLALFGCFATMHGHHGDAHPQNPSVVTAAPAPVIVDGSGVRADSAHGESLELAAHADIAEFSKGSCGTAASPDRAVTVALALMSSRNVPPPTIKGGDTTARSSRAGEWGRDLLVLHCVSRT